MHKQDYNFTSTYTTIPTSCAYTQPSQDPGLRIQDYVQDYVIIIMQDYLHDYVVVVMAWYIKAS